MEETNPLDCIFSEILIIKKISETIYDKYIKLETCEAFKLYKSETSYDYVSMVTAGFCSQIKKEAKIINYGNINVIKNYQLINSSIIQIYFEDLEKYHNYISYLCLEQRVLDLCAQSYSK